MKPEIKIFKNHDELAFHFAEEFILYVNKKLKNSEKFSVALSGGSTPLLFFRKLAGLNSSSSYQLDWEKVHLFWGDERCVPPENEDSNYGAAKKTLLKTIDIPEENVHRIIGESDPAKEAERYSGEIRSIVDIRNNFPGFDWILLGLGEDGHTASVFPDQLDLLYSPNDCEVAVHPATGQKRITLTGKVLINASRITFLVSGEAKKERVREILTGEPTAKRYPAYFIKPLNGKFDWFLDKAAASLLNM